MHCSFTANQQKPPALAAFSFAMIQRYEPHMNKIEFTGLISEFFKNVNGCMSYTPKVMHFGIRHGCSNNFGESERHRIEHLF